MSQEIRILLVDDHNLFRESLGQLLQHEPDFRIVGKCGSIREALDVMDREQTDIVLLDHDLGDERGATLQVEAKKRGFQGLVLMVTAGMSDADTLSVLKRGASGIFLKHSPPAQLVQAIRQVVRGENWLDPKAMQAVLGAATGKTERQPAIFALTARERAVLKGILEGFTNKEMSAQLQLSLSSVKAVIQQLFDKAGVRTRGQLVRIALEKHWQD
jgi:two-component system, NarL family, nitrate/nitrite response regulator NarL